MHHSKLIRLAAALPKGSSERKGLLRVLRNSALPRPRQASGMNKRLDEGRYKDEVDLAFANYALNELSFFLDEDMKEYARENYGGLAGVVGGMIYSGGRIDTEDKLRELKSLRAGGQIRVHMRSFSHYESVAREFANFVKSYDPMIGLMQMEAALARGSAGKLGSFVMVVKADPDTILINTARKDGVTSSAEPELIVDGTVKVLEVRIFEPLTENNWAERTLEEWRSLKDLEGSGFLAAWIEKHKVDPWPHLENFLERAVHTPRDLADLLLSDSNLIQDNQRKISAWAVHHPAASKFIDEIELLQSSSSKDLSFVFEGRRISPGKELSLKILKLKGVPALLEVLEAKTESLKRWMQVAPQSYKKSFYLGGSPVTELWDVLRVLSDLSAVGALKKSHASPVKDFNKWIKKIIREETGSERIYPALGFHRALLSEIRENPWKKASTPEETLSLLSAYTMRLYNTLNSREFSHLLSSLDPETRRELQGALPDLLSGSLKAMAVL